MNFPCWQIFECNREGICLAYKFRDKERFIYFCGKYCMYDKFSICIHPHGFTAIDDGGLESVCIKCKNRRM